VKNIFLVLVPALIFQATAKAQTCDDLPANFRSYNEATRAIQNTSFVLTDELPFGKSSWFLSAAYYSCDNYFGYLVYSTQDRKEHILEGVPLKVWTEFKTAKVTVTYYIQNVKGKYRMVPD
jgi:hypothetical protein